MPGRMRRRVRTRLLRARTDGWTCRDVPARVIAVLLRPAGLGDMRNERLRALLLERGETPEKLAEAVHVDAKTVERWITKGRVPYRKHRYDVAAFFGVDESYIWPGALGPDEVAAVSQSEVVAVYPHRWAVPRDVWGHFFGQAEREIGALVYSGMFMAEDIGVHRLFADRARAGVRVRLLLGDPDSRNVAERGTGRGHRRGDGGEGQELDRAVPAAAGRAERRAAAARHGAVQLDLPRR